MQPFIEPIKTALFIFPFLSFVLVTPYMFYQYRKHGAISVFRTLIIFSFIYYLMNAYFLVILPLPPRDSVTNTYQDMIQLRPFQFIIDLRKESVFRIGNPNTFIPALTQPVFTQLVFNIILTLPFGFYLRYYFKKDKKTTVLYTFFLSLFFELSQLSGLFFIYPGPYRLFDVDDLILNTLGGLLGYFSVSFVSSFLPSRDEIDYLSYLKANRVSLLKRVFAFSIDITILNFVFRIFSMFISNNQLILNFIIFIIYFSIIPSFFLEQTLAQRLLKMRLVDKQGNQASFISLLKRSILIYIFVYKSVSIINIISELMVILESRAFAILYIVVLAVWLLSMTTYWIYIMIKRPKQLFYDRLSQVYLVSTFYQD